jgi:hypothetical protein
MPNYVTNILTARGKPPDVGKFFDAIRGVDPDGNPLYIDFNKIIPMPAQLGVTSGATTLPALRHYVLKQERDGVRALQLEIDLKGYALLVFQDLSLVVAHRQQIKGSEEEAELLRLGEIYYNNIREYGHPTWYEWCIAHWGTKWPAFDQEVCDHNTILFVTANTGVSPLIQELSAQYPNITLEYEYADEDWGQNVGEFTFADGQCLRAHTPEGGSADARIIAERILGENPYADDEE